MTALADCLIAFELRGLDGNAYEEKRTEEAERVQLLMKHDADESNRHPQSATNNLNAHAREQLRGRRPFHWPVEFPEVFARGGFDAFIGNPPFMGGRKISTNLGSDYLAYLLCTREAITGIADLVCHFFRRGFELLRGQGTLGLIATNSISESDSREGGLKQIAQDGGVIYRAFPTIRWPGTAAVEVSIVHICKGDFKTLLLNDVPVATITSSLTSNVLSNEDPMHLASNLGFGFSGSFLLGDGFKLTSEEAEFFLAKEPRSKELIKSYLTGSDLNESSVQQICIYAIDPEKRTEAEMTEFPMIYKRLKELVYPERQLIKDVAKKKYWWRFAGTGNALYESIAELDQCLVTSRHAKNIIFARVPVIVRNRRVVFDNSVIVIPLSKFGHFALLQSSLHTGWAEYWGSKIRQFPRYTPTEVLETFPFPAMIEPLNVLGERYLGLRAKILSEHSEGLTKTYNRFHDRGEKSEDIARLRALHMEMDQAVAAAYGWSDLDLGHGFHETKQGVRYTFSESARRTVLAKLLELNHQRYAEEIKTGLHDKKGKRAAGGAKRTSNTRDEMRTLL